MGFWVGWLGLRLYLARGRRTRVIIISGDNHVLLVKSWLGSGKWILPGGGLHHGEAKVAGAIREVREETGLRLEASQLREIHKETAREYGLRFKAVIFEARLSDRPPVTAQRFELVEAAWLPLTALEDLSPATARLLEQWQADKGFAKIQGGSQR